MDATQAPVPGLAAGSRLEFFPGLLKRDIDAAALVYSHDYQP
jgi:hypothetical protein